MIDPDLVRNGIHHCATDGNACGGCPIEAYCDYGNLDPEIIKTIDVMLLSQEEFKDRLLKGLNASFNETLNQFMKEHPECITKPEIEVRLYPPLVESGSGCPVDIRKEKGERE